MQALTIGDLERGSGVPRSTIYYYVRSGLLPPAQKASPSRGIYTDDHLELLREIRRLKDEDGLSLEDARQRLAPKLGAAAVNEVDLVAQQGEQTRTAILRTAAREFARKGYRQTRVSDITRQLGVRPRTLYRHFPTKRDLFAAAYVACLNAAMAVVEPPLEADPDLAVRVVWRTLGDYGLRTLNSDLLYLIREAADDDPATTRALRAAYEHSARTLPGCVRRPTIRRSLTNCSLTPSSARSRACGCAPRAMTGSRARTSCGTTSSSCAPSLLSTTARWTSKDSDGDTRT